MTSKTRLPLLLLAIALLVAVAVPQAGAIVPPRDCKTITVSGKRYNIKSDQLRCTTARTYAERYLRSRSRPSGYVCKRYTGSKLVFRCVNAGANPDKTFFAIKK